MENNNQNEKNIKENKGITRFLIFIIVLLLLIIGIGVGWYLSKNGESINKNEEPEINSATKIEVIEKTREMTTNEIYSIYSKNMQNKIKSLGKDLPKELEGNNWINIKDIYDIEDFPVEGTYVNEKLEAYISLKGTGNKIKILDNAINCGVCSVGNGGTTFVIWAVDINGYLYTKIYDTQDTANKMNFNLIKNQDLKNVLEVIQCSGPSARYPLAIDISGNAYDL